MLRFGAGASSNSSKLAHGGLRYLQQYDFKLVKSCLRERDLLLSNLPDYVKPQPFIFPVRLDALFSDEPEILELPEDEENVAPVGAADARELRGRGREFASAYGHRVAVEELAELEFNALTQEGLPVGYELFPTLVTYEGRFRRGGDLPAGRACPARRRGTRAGKGSDRGGGPLRRRLPRFCSFRGRGGRRRRVGLMR